MLDYLLSARAESYNDFDNLLINNNTKLIDTFMKTTSKYQLK